MSVVYHMEIIALDINFSSGRLNVQLESGIVLHVLLCAAGYILHVLLCDTGYLWTSSQRI